MPPDVSDLIRDALAEGRHSDVYWCVCDGCREWTDRIWQTTADGKRLCPACAPPDVPRLTYEELDRLRAPEDRGKPL